MYPVTNAFTAEMRQPSMKATVSIVTTTGVVLSAVNGRVDMDSARAIGRICDLELMPTATLTVDQIYALIMSPNMEIRVSRGLIINGITEMVPLGVFSTDSATKSKTESGSINWQGSDRSKKIGRARFTDVYVIDAGTTLAVAGASLLQFCWAPTPTDFSNVLQTLAAPLTFDAGASSNPWELAKKLFADYGYELVFNGLGIAKALPIPDPSTIAAAFDFGTGSTNLVTGGEVQGSFEGVFNGVIVTGEGSNIDPPVQGVAWDTDPTSPTYYLGGYGRAPYFEQTSILTTSADCLTAAKAILAKVKGRKEQFSWPSVVNPALEPLDVVTVTIKGVVSRLVIDKLTIPLRASDPMTATARETSVN